MPSAWLLGDAGECRIEYGVCGPVAAGSQPSRRNLPKTRTSTSS
jgi:hypothetical protein